jgi:hypothetical protein
MARVAAWGMIAARLLREAAWRTQPRGELWAPRSLVPALSQHSNRPWLRAPCKPAMQERALVQLVDDVEHEPGQMIPEQLRTHVR